MERITGSFVYAEHLSIAIYCQVDFQILGFSFQWSQLISLNIVSFGFVAMEHHSSN